MKTGYNLVNRLSRNFKLGLFGAGLGAIVASCAPLTVAQQEAILGSALMVAGEFNLAGTETKGERFLNDAMVISGGVVSQQAQMRHQLEVANAGKSQIVINNNPPIQQQNQVQVNTPERDRLFYEMWDNSSYKKREEIIEVFDNIDRKTALPKKLQELDRWYKYMEDNPEMKNINNNSTPVGLFSHMKWVDFNENQRAEREEFLGLNSSSYNLNQLDGIWFSFYGGGNFNGQNLKLKIYRLSDGTIMNYFNQRCESSRIQDFYCDSKFFTTSGNYKAVLNTGNGETFTNEFRIIK